MTSKLSAFLLLAACSFMACKGGGEIRTTDRPATGMVATDTMAVADGSFGGLALYTLRDEMAEDPKGTLKRVASIGYAYVEAAGYQDGMFYGMSPVDFKAYLAEVGLTPKSSHMPQLTTENLDRSIADVKAAGFEYLVIPVPPMGAFSVDEQTRTLSMNQDVATVAANVNMIAERCAAAGLKALYHNHDFEFKPDANGTVFMDYLIENSDPDNLNFELDLYWITKAGADPVAYFDKYPGRFTAWHVKDMDSQGRFAPVGRGGVDFGRILEAKHKSGMEFYFVEQDQTFSGQAPMDAILISHASLKKLGFM